MKRSVNALKELLDMYENGYFVDVGAASASLSNTLDLERRGWHGLCIDPHPIHCEWMRQNRSCIVEEAVCAKDVREETFIFQQPRPFLAATHCQDIIERDRQDLWGSGLQCAMTDDYVQHVVKSVPTVISKIQTISLSDLLVKHQSPNVIEFLNIDVEGAEYEVLLGIDFSKYHFQVMAIEVWDHNLDSVVNLLQQNMYIIYSCVKKDYVFISGIKL